MPLVLAFCFLRWYYNNGSLGGTESVICTHSFQLTSSLLHSWIVGSRKTSCDGLVNNQKHTYLKAYFIWGLLLILLDGVGRRDRRSVDRPVLADYESVASVVELEPVENGPAGDYGADESGESLEIC